MKPPAFAYRRAEHLDDAVVLLARYGADARVLAGGQSLLPILNRRLARPRVVVDVSRTPDLAGIGVAADGVTVGAAATQRDVERSRPVAATSPLVPQALAWVGSVATKSRGTVAGSIAFGDPLGELPAVLLALDGDVEAVSARGRRTIAAGDLYAGPFETTLAADELIASVRFPAPPPKARTCYLEVARRCGVARATVGVAAVVAVADGRVTTIRLALAGCGPAPVRATAAEGALAGQRPTAALIEDAAAAAARELTPPTTIDADAQTRRLIATTLIRRALATTIAETR